MARGMLSAPPVPRPSPRPVPRRLPARKRMTIAIGILATDGVVVAADTQESVPGYWKRDQGKISGRVVMSNGYHAAYLSTGSGDARFIDAMSGTLSNGILGPPPGIEEIEARIERKLYAFHKKHIFPLKSEIPDFDLLIAAQCSGSARLWVTRLSSVTESQNFDAVGIGAHYAVSFLGRLWKYGALDVEAAARLAAYVVYRTKQYIEGCGNYTDVSYLRANDITELTRDQTEAMERQFRLYSEQLEPELLRSVFGADITAGHLSREIRKMRRKLEDIVPWVRSAGRGPRRSSRSTADAVMPSVSPLPRTRPAARRSPRGSKRGG